MSIIKVFRNYMDAYHPYLADKEWKADVQTVSVDDISYEEVKALYSSRIQTGTNLLGILLRWRRIKRCLLVTE
ncbi:hypothetical protein [Planococcus rifietoensis]|uniref:hypothetical protein n=1 Tax=Planococcus rifietoensis TaxID=200991 RepID=UPI00384CCB12